MDKDKYDPNDAIIQLVLAKQQIKFTEDLNALQKQLDLKKQELMFVQEAINRDIKKASKKRGKAKFLAFIVSILFLFSTLLISYGYSLTSSTSSDLHSPGWLMITLGGISYLIATIITISPTQENN